MGYYAYQERRSWRRHRGRNSWWLTDSRIPYDLKIRLVKMAINAHARGQIQLATPELEHISFDEELPIDIALKIAKLVQGFVR